MPYPDHRAAYTGLPRPDTLSGNAAEKPRLTGSVATLNQLPPPPIATKPHLHRHPPTPETESDRHSVQDGNGRKVDLSLPGLSQHLRISEVFASLCLIFQEKNEFRKVIFYADAKSFSQAASFHCSTILLNRATLGCLSVPWA